MRQLKNIGPTLKVTTSIGEEFFLNIHKHHKLDLNIWGSVTLHLDVIPIHELYKEILVIGDGSSTLTFSGAGWNKKLFSESIFPSFVPPVGGSILYFNRQLGVQVVNKENTPLLDWPDLNNIMDEIYIPSTFLNTSAELVSHGDNVDVFVDSGSNVRSLSYVGHNPSTNPSKFEFQPFKETRPIYRDLYNEQYVEVQNITNSQFSSGGFTGVPHPIYFCIVFRPVPGYSGESLMNGGGGTPYIRNRLDTHYRYGLDRASPAGVWRDSANLVIPPYSDTIKLECQINGSSSYLRFNDVVIEENETLVATTMSEIYMNSNGNNMAAHIFYYGIKHGIPSTEELSLISDVVNAKVSLGVPQIPWLTFNDTRPPISGNNFTNPYTIANNPGWNIEDFVHIWWFGGQSFPSFADLRPIKIIQGSVGETMSIAPKICILMENISIGESISFNYDIGGGNVAVSHSWVASRTGPGEVTKGANDQEDADNYITALQADIPGTFNITSYQTAITIETPDVTDSFNTEVYTGVGDIELTVYNNQTTDLIGHTVITPDGQRFDCKEYRNIP